MSELRELYQDLILDHGRRPRNFLVPEGHNCRAEGHNPLCGDRISIYLCCDGDTVREIGIQGAGCAICMASASTMTEVVKGKAKPDIERMCDAFTAWIVKGDTSQRELLPNKLSAFEGVKEFPMRVKCATLAWHTLKAAIAGQGAATSERE
jgi:nitrogen fixation NifU-like protein